MHNRQSNPLFDPHLQEYHGSWTAVIQYKIVQLTIQEVVADKVADDVVKASLENGAPVRFWVLVFVGE